MQDQLSLSLRSKQLRLAECRLGAVSNLFDSEARDLEFLSLTNLQNIC